MQTGAESGCWISAVHAAGYKLWLLVAVTMWSHTPLSWGSFPQPRRDARSSEAGSETWRKFNPFECSSGRPQLAAAFVKGSSYQIASECTAQLENGEAPCVEGKLHKDVLANHLWQALTSRAAGVTLLGCTQSVICSAVGPYCQPSNDRKQGILQVIAYLAFAMHC